MGAHTLLLLLHLAGTIINKKTVTANTPILSFDGEHTPPFDVPDLPPAKDLEYTELEIFLRVFLNIFNQRLKLSTQFFKLQEGLT